MEISSLSLVIGFNESDGTYGWNADMSGYTLFYSHFTDDGQEESHYFPLSPGIIPIARFQTLYKSWLNVPFTRCQPTIAMNTYEEWRKRIIKIPVYKKQ